MDEYTRDSYTGVRATRSIQEAVDHVLSQRQEEVSEDLWRELQQWRKQRREGENARDRDEWIEDLNGTEEIPFELVRRVHEELKKTPMGMVDMQQRSVMS